MKNYKRVQQKLSKAHHVEHKGVCVTLVLTNYIRSGLFFSQTDNLDWSDERQHLSLKYQQAHSVDDRLSC